MADTYLPLMAGVIAALKADGTLSGIVSDRIYSFVPQETVFPYVKVSIESNAFGNKTSADFVHSVRVQGFSQINTPSEAASIRSAVFDVLNRNEAGITVSGANLVMMEFDGLADVFIEDDGKTWQSIIEFNAYID